MNKQILKTLLQQCRNTGNFAMSFNKTGQLTNILTRSTILESYKQPVETWHTGSRPPFVGWWRNQNVFSGTVNIWRYWNGDYWSFSAHENLCSLAAGLRAKPYITLGDTNVSWCWAWPDNARVPRIEPLAFERIREVLPQFEDWTINQFLERLSA